MRSDADKQSIKYRSVGALVIILSFSLAWFLLLDHDVKRQSQWQNDIPEAIEIERFTVIEEREVQALNVSSDEKKTMSETALAPNPEKKSIDKATTTQVINREKKEAPPKVEKVAVKPSKKVPSKKSYTYLNKKGLPQAWVLQVASFKEKTNARDLQQTLLKQDFPAYIKRFNLASGQIYRVLLGPKMEKKTLSLMAKKVERKLGMKTLLVSYKPEYAQK